MSKHGWVGFSVEEIKKKYCAFFSSDLTRLQQGLCQVFGCWLVRRWRPPKPITHGLLDKVIVLVIDEYHHSLENKLYRSGIDHSEEYIQVQLIDIDIGYQFSLDII